MDKKNCPKTHPVELALSFLSVVFIVWANHTLLDFQHAFIARRLFGLAAMIMVPLMMVWEPKYFTEYIPRVHRHQQTKIIGLSLLLLMAVISAIRIF